jgi:menaquinone-dependent protoporphyrinogen oxidase
MARVLILYGTAEGQTASISGYIAEVARDGGHEAKTLDIKELPGEFALDAYTLAVEAVRRGEDLAQRTEV